MLPMTVLKALLLFSIAAEAVPTRSVVRECKKLCLLENLGLSFCRDN